MTDRTGWQSLGDLSMRALVAAPRLASSLSEREAAAALALDVWGAKAVEDVPAWVNLAAVAVAARGELCALLLKPGVPELVAREAAALTSVTELPALLRTERAWVVEPVGWQRGGALWSDTWSLAGYAVGTADPAHFLLGLPGEGIRVERWYPMPPGDPAAWVREDGMGPAITPSAADAQVAWTAAAARYAVALGRAIDAGRIVRTLDARQALGAGAVVRAQGYELPGALRRPKPGVARHACKRR